MSPTSASRARKADVRSGTSRKGRRDVFNADSIDDTPSKRLQRSRGSHGPSSRDVRGLSSSPHHAKARNGITSNAGSGRSRTQGRSTGSSANHGRARAVLPSSSISAASRERNISVSRVSPQSRHRTAARDRIRSAVGTNGMPRTARTTASRTLGGDRIDTMSGASQQSTLRGDMGARIQKKGPVGGSIGSISGRSGKEDQDQDTCIASHGGLGVGNCGSNGDDG